LADEFQRLAFFEVKMLRVWLLLDWLCFERRNPRGNIVGIHAGAHGRFRFEGWKFVLHLLSVFGADPDEGVNRADCHVEADALAKNANDVAIRSTFAPQLANQFAVNFEFGARRFLRDRIQQAKKGRVHDFQAP
jgi:hypothetical protein